MNDIATTKDFQERMFDRIRSQIGELMTDDDLKRIVEAAMEKAFFERQAMPSQYSGVTYDDAVFVKLTRELLKPQVTTAVHRWMSENAERVQELVVAETKAALPAIVLGVIKGAAEAQCFALVETLKGQGLMR